jgi:hypothetical protein
MANTLFLPTTILLERGKPYKELKLSLWGSEWLSLPSWLSMFYPKTTIYPLDVKNTANSSPMRPSMNTSLPDPINPFFSTYTLRGRLIVDLPNLPQK